MIGDQGPNYLLISWTCLSKSQQQMDLGHSVMPGFSPPSSRGSTAASSSPQGEGRGVEEEDEELLGKL